MAHSFIGRFNEELYSLKVGSEPHVFTAHKSVLSLSPVFARMTNSSFSESITKEIVLPEDDADSFGRILEHLYGNNDATFDLGRLHDLDYAATLADMYGLAEKYLLPDIQNHILRILKYLNDVDRDEKMFFYIAHLILQKIQDEDKIVEPYFAEQATEQLDRILTVEV